MIALLVPVCGTGLGQRFLMVAVLLTLAALLALLLAWGGR